MNTLCLDIGTHMGWSIDLSGISIESGVANLSVKKKQHQGVLYLNAKDLLEARNSEWKIDRIVYEDVKAHKGVQAAHVYGGLLGVVLSWAATRGVPCIGIGVGTIKKHATGKGNAKKDAMIASAVERGHSPADDNEADAIAILYASRDLL